MDLCIVWYKIQIVDVVCSLIPQERINVLVPTWHAYGLKPGEYSRMITLRKMSWDRVPVRLVSVSRQLSMIEEQCQYQSRLFRAGGYSNKGHDLENSWIRVLVRVVSVSRKVSKIEERRKDQSCLFPPRDYRNNSNDPENSWVRVLVRLGGEVDNCQNFFVVL